MAFEFGMVKTFAQESEDLYSAMKIYSENCYLERKGETKAFSEVSKTDMEKAINKEFSIELGKRSNIPLKANATKDDIKRYSMNPLVKFYANEIRDMMIDMILPDTLLNGTLKYFAEFKFADLGDSLKFDIENNSLFTVTKAGERKRRSNLQKLYNTTVTMVGQNHQITIGTDLYEILIGFASMAKDVMKAARSIETYMMFEGYDQFTSTMGALTGNLEVLNYSEPSLIKLCQTVETYNQGMKPIILGTPVALKSVLPSNSNYRYMLDDEYVKLGHVQTFNGYDVVSLSQVANPYNTVQYSLKLDDSKIYVVSPASQKLVQIGVFGGTYTDQDGIYDNANKLQLTSTEKHWEVGTATNAVAGIVKNLG